MNVWNIVEHSLSIVLMSRWKIQPALQKLRNLKERLSPKRTTKTTFIGTKRNQIEEIKVKTHIVAS